MIRIVIGIVIGFYISEFNILPEILDFTNQSGLTDYFIDKLQDIKQEQV